MKFLNLILILILTICSSALYSAEGVISNEEFKKFISVIQYPSQKKNPPVNYPTGPIEVENLGIPQFDTAVFALKRLTAESWHHVMYFELPPEVLLNKMDMCTKLMLKHVEQEISESECLKPTQFSKHFLLLDHLIKKILVPWPKGRGFQILDDDFASLMPFLRRAIERYKFEIATKNYAGQKIRALFLKKQLSKAKKLLKECQNAANKWHKKLSYPGNKAAKKWQFYKEAWPNLYFNKF